MTRHILDILTQLRDVDDTAESSSPAAETGIALDITPFHYLNDQMDYGVKAVMHNLVITGGATSVIWAIQVADTLAFDNTVKDLVTLDITGLSGRIEAILDFATALDLMGGDSALYVRSKVTFTGGTSPTVDYGAFLTKH